MSIYTHDGRKFRIEWTLHVFSDGSRDYDIYDDEGYRLLTNFDRARLGIYQRAVELSGDSDRNLKIVLDFAPYTADGRTLRHNDRCHSLWVKPEYKELPKFWELYEVLKKHPSAVRLCEKSEGGTK